MRQGPDNAKAETPAAAKTNVEIEQEGAEATERGTPVCLFPVGGERTGTVRGLAAGDGCATRPAASKGFEPRITRSTRMRQGPYNAKARRCRDASRNQRELVRVATEFLAAETARDRALGETLLAFQGDLASEAKLAQCVDSDASFWVREHAKWCSDVCAAERACMQRYREILSSGSLHELAVGLAELGPALTHMSRSWRSVIEKDMHWPHSDRRMVIYLQNFWWRWKRTNSNTENTEVCNRRLRHYCRGERLKEGLTNRQAPWWKLDD
jgi:hypothetical protein